MNANRSCLPALLLLPLVSLLTLLATLFAVTLGHQLAYRGRIFPTVRVGEIDLSGLTPAEAAARLQTAYDYPHSARFTLRDGEKTWTFSPYELGILFDPARAALQAYQVGRRGGVFQRLSEQWRARRNGIVLPLELTFDQRIAALKLEEIAAQVNRPTIEASLQIDGVDVVVRQGQVGRHLNVPAMLTILQTYAQAMTAAEIPLVIEEDPPVILDAEAQAEVARRILSAPLTLTLPGAGEDGPGPWLLPRETLASMLEIKRIKTADGEAYQVLLSEKKLSDFLAQIAPGLERPPENARFIFNDDTRQLELIRPAQDGQALDIPATIAAINQALLAGEHEVALDMEYSSPQVGDEATAESLGITELVSSHTTYFYGSDPARRQNIRTAAGRFHGLLVPPGAVFSMAEVLGDVSLDTGYAEAWIIFGDRTIKGVGGGVCQVSTTLFRTVFFGGYPIVERYPHAYRVYYYEQTYGGGHDSRMAGLDATVYVPVVDFKFKNDTPYWLLMETYVGNNSLTWKFYSTSDGRTVEWHTTGLVDEQDPPEPRYIENPDLAPGEIRQVDWAVAGGSVTVTRTVYRDGQVIDEDVIQTHYVPWRAVCEYGPGTEGMPPKDPDPDHPCRPDS
ncbi:MAG: hypothetical protein D6803_04740 [Anaerolineae bacterium]|nr:MAG: hypothetical protein D6803_04740 [Anaerolineae bacterium]